MKQLHEYVPEDDRLYMKNLVRRAKIYAIVIVISVLLLTALSCNANAATTYASVNAKVRTWLYEPIAAYSIYSDAQIYDAITAAQEFVIDALPNSAHQQLYAMTSGTASVGLATVPADLRKVIAVEFNGIPAIQLKYSDVYSRTPKATASSPYYMILNGYFYFYPASSYGYKITYMKKATQYTNGASLSIADEYIHIVVEEAVRTMLLMDNQAARAQTVSALIQSQIAAIRENLQNSNVVENPTASGVKN